MSEEKFSARAKATVILEIDCASNWGTGTTMDQVYKQAREDAAGHLNTLLSPSTSPDHRADIARRFNVVGVVKIDAVIAARKAS